MAALTEVLADVQLVVYIALAVAALWQWRRRRGEAAAWLAATFSAIAVFVIVNELIGSGPSTGLELWVRKANICLLLLFPYLLYRFMRTFLAPLGHWPLVVNAVTAGILGWTLLLPSLPGSGEPRPIWLSVYVFGVLAHWTIASGVASLRLLLAGRTQPAIARNRMVTMGSGALVLNVALLLALVGQSGSGIRLTTQVLSIVSSVLFYVGFAPPTLLRAIWRRPAEQAMRRTQLGLVASVGQQDVAHELLRFVHDIFGGTGALLADREGEVIAAVDLTDHEVRRILETFRDVGEVPGTMTMPLRSGLVAVQASPFTPFFGEDEISLLEALGSFIDLALERAELHSREREAVRDVERAHNELEELVFGLSHDLKNPVITMVGYLDLLRSEYGERLDEQGQEFLARMESSARYTQDLLNDLLELSRIGRTQTEPAEVDLTELLRQLREDVHRREPAAQVEATTLPVILLNPARARQLFTNLIENALHHGGRDDITIRVTSSRTEEGGALIRVSDDGRGIPREDRERVFRIFERLESGGGRTGTGIGLAICRRIVESAGGTIAITDGGVGTTFELSFPPTTVPMPRTDTVGSMR